MVRKPRRHEQNAERRGENDADRPRRRGKKVAHQSGSDDEVEKSPKHIDDRRGLADPRRRGERRLEFVAANTLHEMRYAVGEERPGEEMREIVIPRHDTCSFCLAPNLAGSISPRAVQFHGSSPNTFAAAKPLLWQGAAPILASSQPGSNACVCFSAVHD